MLSQLSFDQSSQLAELTVEEYKDQCLQHQSALLPFIKPHLDRANHQIKHAVFDFLFEYYSFRPAQLMHWSPGLTYQINLAQQSTKGLTDLKAGYINKQGYFRIDAKQFPAHRLAGLHRAIALLTSTQKSAPHYGCFGLHEWAMIYDKKDIRHPQLQLRFHHDDIRSIVESSQLSCTHYDAARFFSRTAIDFNSHLLDKDNRHEYEQSACLHSNMDIYRWAFKYYPWIDSNIIREAFLLAKDIREFDMRASPYDVSPYGLTSIKVETAEGKKAYIDFQKATLQQAKPLREKLISQLSHLAQQHSSINE